MEALEPEIEEAILWYQKHERHTDCCGPTKEPRGKLFIEQIVAEFIKHKLGVTELPGRNRPCYCGSGIKFKKCCLPLEEQ